MPMQPANWNASVSQSDLNRKSIQRQAIALNGRWPDCFQGDT